MLASSVSTKPTLLKEHAGYFSVPGAHLYTVVHQVAEPVARVLLVGPFASERHVAYHYLVRWARFLARHRIEVLRYDYRGVGESTGAFEETKLEDCYEDSLLVTAWAASVCPGVPLLIHGVELGAIVAARIFYDGFGDAMLAWSPPASANDVLRSILKRWSTLEQFDDPLTSRSTFTELVQQLEQGKSIEVQGYLWPSQLWSDSYSFRMPEAFSIAHNRVAGRERPTKLVQFGRKPSSSLSMPYPRFPVIRDLTPLYNDTLNWIISALNLTRNQDESVR